MHKTQSQRKNHYTQSILTPRLQLLQLAGKAFFDLRYAATKYIDVGFDTLIITQSQRKNHYTQSILTPRLQLLQLAGKAFFDLRYAATKYIDVGFDTLIITQHSSNR
jgi:hypothetical protein